MQEPEESDYAWLIVAIVVLLTLAGIWLDYLIHH